MEFIKVGKNYMIKNGNGRIISEKEKLELENQELIIKDIQSNECQGKTTQKIIKNKKRLKKIEKVLESKTYRNPYNENIIKDELIIDEKGNKILKRNVTKNKPNITEAQVELSKKVFEHELKQMKATNEFAKKYIETAPQEENADDTIEETDSTL